MAVGGGGEGQGLAGEEPDVLGDLEGGQGLAAEGPQLAGGSGPPLLQHHHRGQRLLLARVGHADHVGLLDGGVAEEDLLDLEGGDVEAARLHHVLDATVEAETAVGVEPAEVAGEEEAVGVEGGRVLLGVPVVAGGDVAPERDLADLAGRERAVGGGGGDLDFHPRQRPAHRVEAGGPGGGGGGGGGICGGPGGAAHGGGV